MVTERFQTVALPKSVDPDAPFHVSVFVGPELTPDRAEGKLAEFTHFPDWAELIATEQAFVEIMDQDGRIDSKPLLDLVNPAVWNAMFPPDTPVRGKQAPDFMARDWRTFRAAVPHDGAKLMHLIAMVSDPTSPPTPSRHPFGVVLNRLDEVLSGLDQFEGREWDESRITRVLDNLIGEGEGNKRDNLRGLERALSQLPPLSRLTAEMHRARRFYERPESVRPPGERHERPLEGATTLPPPRPEPDFHERCALVADNPGLQRHLGLVIDLVADVERLRNSNWIRARVVPNGDTTASQGSRTLVNVVGSDLVTVPSTDDWVNGQLRLGDTARFGVLDMDPDGTALKLDRYLWSFPRYLKVESSGAPISGAPAALRSLGFTVVRHENALEVQDKLSTQLSFMSTTARRPALHTEDVTQGMRVDVWDDTAKAWFTLHGRLVTAVVDGHGPVLTDVIEEGFIQGTTLTETVGVEDSAVHAHEAMFGWQGWSLSATRPGNRVRHEDGEEIVEDPDTDPDPITPLVVATRAQPGTLPRLRYGRSYKFRAWSVDLAGNSRERQLGSPPPPTPAAVSAVQAALATAPQPTFNAVSNLIPELRADTASVLMRDRFVAEPSVRPTPGLGFSLVGEVDIDAAVLNRLSARRPGLGQAKTHVRRPAAGARTRATRGTGGVGADLAVGRASLVGQAFSAAALNEREPFLVDSATIDPQVLAHALHHDGRLDLEALPLSLNTVTALRPYLRWDPVQPPTVVARHSNSEGESLLRLVIRSGVDQDLDTLELTVTPPAVFGPANGHRETSERHIAPPKTSQTEAETHGAFDAAIGSTDPADHNLLLGAAVREKGTWFDIEVPRLDDPNTSDPQPGIALANDPDVPPSTFKTLPLPQGDPPATGQYIVHDTDQVRLPYLPDVVGRGISLVFQEAGADRQIIFPFGTEGFTARYPGRWPERDCFRLVLQDGPELDGRLSGRVLQMSLPPGDIQKFRLSSSMSHDDLDLFGLWRMLPPLLRDNPDIAEAAADGWLWALTPFDQVTLVHAVPRPLEVPRPTALTALRRGEGATDAFLVGAIDIHGPSTDSVTAEVSWVDQVDDLSFPEPQERPETGVGFTTSIRAEEDLAVLAGGPEDVRVDIDGFGPVWVHSAIHKLNDTRHRNITYRFRAATRFREYFDPATLVGNGETTADGVRDDGQSVLGPATTLAVPSSAKPAAPVVHSVIPLFRWDEGTEPEQPVATRSRRRAGVRIYLERPWFSSGEDELLGVLLGRLGNDDGVEESVSQWGSDPVWLGDQVDRRSMYLEFDNLMHILGLDDRPGDARPVVPPADLPLTSERGSPTVTVLGYRPQFNAERGLWYVDVAIDPGSTFWPFVRLAVARYQPNSIAGCHLSEPVKCDYVQLTPERTLSVSRTDVRSVRVVVDGPVGVRSGVGDKPTFPGPLDLPAAVGANRRVVARLQRRDPDIPTDLGWATVDSTELEIRGLAGSQFEPAWVGALASPVNIALRRPGTSQTWRVVVEEWEYLPGDPANLAPTATIAPITQPVWEQRLIYADEVAL